MDIAELRYDADATPTTQAEQQETG